MTETTASITTTSDCRRCHGTGQIRAGLNCPSCKGTGLAPVAVDDDQHTHHPDDVAAGNLPTDTERAQGGDDDPIAPATITVREYLEGEEEGPVFLHTHLGALQVTGVNFHCDGPWLSTGHGWLTASWCVAYSDRLYFDKAEAERSAS